MSINSINRRREDLIKQISQIEDEELLISLEDQIFTYQQGAREPLSCPESMQIRSVAHFRSLIDQVLEDDRNGKMLDADEVFAELEIISPLAKKQLKELKDFNQILYGTSRANQIYFSIKDCLQVLTDFPGLGYIEPTLQDYPQCFRTFFSIRI